MRSELIFGTMAYVSNRFLMVMLAAKATRKLHRPNTRIQDTTNDVFEHFTRAKPDSSRTVCRKLAVVTFRCVS